MVMSMYSWYVDIDYSQYVIIHCTLYVDIDYSLYAVQVINSETHKWFLLVLGIKVAASC